MKSNRSDYLKYWRVIRQYVKVRYGLNQADLDMLLFLYSEKYFGKDKFQEFNELLSWDEKRFNRMIGSIYKKLNGEEIPMTMTNNPMFLKNVDYSDKVYRNMIKYINAEARRARLTGQEPHHVPE